jgi:hypothetical protein
MHVGLSDTWFMSNDVTYAQASPPAYKDLGIPATVASAKAMTAVQLRAAVTKAIAYTEDTAIATIQGWPTATDGSIAVESQLGVEVFNEFTAHLVGAKYPIDLAKIRQAKWASVEGLASVITDTYTAMKEPKAKVQP